MWRTSLSCLLLFACGGDDLAPRGAAVDAAPVSAESLAAEATVVIPHEADLEFEEPHELSEDGKIGRSLGQFQFTYYWVANESAKSRATHVLKDASCRPIAKVSRGFSRRLIREGTGQLSDGRVVNVAGNCKCGSICYFVASEEKRWGVGVLDRPLKPFRSVAVDPRRVRIGTWLYIAELDGLTMPGVEPWGGFIHDGCVVADDRGGGVKGRQLDLFSGRRSFYKALQRKHGIVRVDVHAAGDRCGTGRSLTPRRQRS